MHGDFVVALTLVQSLLVLYACQAMNSQERRRAAREKNIHCICIAQRSVLTNIQESLFDGGKSLESGWATNKYCLLLNMHQRGLARTDAPRPWNSAMCIGK
mmetsp:Transcript_17807/g.32202  ORF Transcript_17807/g.32202 Transcript_17807/m.32202 type:complete len:101 (+) Transcript_17807:85-387(+)